MNFRVSQTMVNRAERLSSIVLANVRGLRTLLFDTDSVHSAVARDGLGSLAIKGGYVILTFSTTVLLARALGAAGYGVYSYILALVALLTTPAQFGLPTLLVRETSQAMARSQFGLIRGVWQWAIVMAALLVLITVGITFGAAALLQDRVSIGHLHAFYWALVLIPLMAFMNLGAACLNGLRRVLRGQFPVQILLPGVFVIFMLLAMGGAHGNLVSPSEAISLRALAVGCTLLLTLLMLWRVAPRQVFAAVAIRRTREWLLSAVTLLGNQGMQVVNTRSGIIILGLFAASADVGAYRVASQIALLMSIGLPAMNQAVAPHFARLYALGDRERIQRLSTLVARVVLLIGVLTMALVLAWGRQLLIFFYGHEFAGTYEPLIILGLAELFSATVGAVGTLLNMTGNEKEVGKAMVLAVLLNVALSFILVPVWGIVGSAIASSVATVTWNLVLWRVVRRRLRIDTLAFPIPFIKTARDFR